MRWSFHVGRIAGIDVKIHGTFFLLLAWIGYVYYREGGMAAAFNGLLFILLIFLCVALRPSLCGYAGVPLPRLVSDRRDQSPDRAFYTGKRW